MGEVIHGDYSRWVNGGTLHSVTNYALHKALYSGHNDHNYFEIAHTVKYLQNMGDLDLYNFVDNHDVERIYTKLSNKAHFAPVHVLLYTLPGIPSIYYGSEFGIEGKKEKFSDASLRPALQLADYQDAIEKNPCTALIAALGKVRQATPALSYGSYNELLLTNRQYAFARDLDGVRVIVTVNNDDNPSGMNLAAGNTGVYIGALSGNRAEVQGGRINVTIPGNSGEIWIPEEHYNEKAPVLTAIPKTTKVEETRKPEETTKSEKTTIETDNTNASKTEQVEILAGGKAISMDSEKVSAEERNNHSSENETENSPAADFTANEPTSPSDEAAKSESSTCVAPDPNKAPEEMTVEELQAAILAKMAANGPVDDQMRKTVYDNIWHDSLVNWVKSFR